MPTKKEKIVHTILSNILKFLMGVLETWDRSQKFRMSVRFITILLIIFIPYFVGANFIGSDTGSVFWDNILNYIYGVLNIAVCLAAATGTGFFIRYIWFRLLRVYKWFTK